MAQAKKPDTARRAAAAALVRVHKGSWPNMAAGALALPTLSARERAFAGAVFFGTAERLVTLDFLLAPLLSRPLAKMDVEVRAVLQSGLYQMLYMQVPKSAAVNESVQLARAFGKSSAAGMVNAVLRRAATAPWMAAETGAGPNFDGIAFTDEAARLSAVYSVSEAVARAVMAALPNEYEAFLAASFSSGEMCLRTNTLKTNRAALEEALAAKGVPLRKGQLPEALYARLGSVGEEAGFQGGLYHVQGEASQYVCAQMAAGPGQRVLDLCAAPGGKTATLAQQMGGGAGLTACDVRQNRLPLIEQNLARLGIAGVKVLLQDATVHNEALSGQDAVLCDVPCSSLGVMAQKPDLRGTDGANFAALPELQLKVLRSAARYVKKGGRLVYSTCTVRSEENAQVVRGFLAGVENFKLVPPAALPDGALICEDMVTILPHRTGLDGFFVATMERLW